jgi:membrane fusion protein (multidrug efflux system)
VDFAVAQPVVAGLRIGSVVHVALTSGGPLVAAEVIAIDARIDATTRNAMLRAKVARNGASLPPGASVRVRVPVGEPVTVVVVPVTALRRGPGGDHVFVIEPDAEGKLRAHSRTVAGGTMLADEIVVHDGLKAGDRVAATGAFKLREGILVHIAEAETRHAAAPHAK